MKFSPILLRSFHWNQRPRHVSCIRGKTIFV